MDTSKIFSKAAVIVLLINAVLAVGCFADALLVGDLDEDKIISFGDLALLAEDWLSISDVADIDGSGRVAFGDFSLLAANWQKRVSPLVINEFMASNINSYSDPQGDYDDWIEIYNTTDSPIDIGGMYITDTLSNLTRYRIPTGFPAQTTVAGHGYLILWADAELTDGVDHVGFGLAAAGEDIALVAADGVTVLDSLSFKDQLADISYGSYPDGSLNRRYFGIPTPGAANNEGYLGVVPTPAFSRKSGIFFETFDLTISIDSDTAVIHYTTDHSVPTTSSPVYTGPITITETTEVIARAFEAGFADSEVEGKNFVKVSPEISNFNSNLPIVILDSFGFYIDAESNPIFEYPYRNVYAIFIDTNDMGRATLTDEADCKTRGGMRVRGQTSAGFQKKQYKFESWDYLSDDKDVSIFGMPSDSDWIIHSPETDGSYLRNYMTYRLFREMGHYAVRTRLCEVFNNQNDGEVTSADYKGIYIFMERIKITDGRLESERLKPTDNAEPEISGGYVIKQDKGGNSANSFVTDHYYVRLQYDDPNESQLTQLQKQWIKAYCGDLELSLLSSDFDDLNTGYRQYLDVDSFIDYHITAEMSKNVDGFGLSDYMFKPRNDVLFKGPVWDYNWAWGNAFYNDCELTYGWNYTRLLEADSTGYRWYKRLFEDENFYLQYIDRWYYLRKGILNTDNLLNRLDSYAAELGEAIPRDYDAWGRSGDYQDRLDYLKNWIHDRFLWFDDQFRRPPIYSQDGGVIEPGFELTISLAEPPILTKFVDYNDDWSYLDDGTNQVKDWIFTDFEDHNDWPVSSAPFGFGDGDEATVVDYGSDPDNKYITTYFRKKFHVEDVNKVTTLTANLMRDSGVAVYINQDIPRLITDNLPTSGRLLYDTLATNEVEGADENTYHTYVFDPNLLVQGENVLSVEVHLSSLDDEDMSFDCELESIVGHSSTPGVLYYTTNGTDPRLHGGAVNPNAHVYTSPISFSKTTKLITREFDSGTWTARNEAVFQIGNVKDNLRITEFMYNPADPNTEFVELQNIGTTTLNLNMVHFTDGIYFTFGDYNLLPGEYVLVVQDIAYFEAKYGSGYPIAGQYYGSLANSGEEIVLRDAVGDEIHDFDYDDGWYDITDGDGFSMVIRDVYNTDINSWDEKDGWRASSDIGGSPAAEDVLTVPLPGSIVINEVMTNPITGQSDWIELYNTTGVVINIGGWFLSDSTGSDVNNTKFEIPQGVAIPAYGYKVFYENLDFGNITNPGCNIPFGLSSKGDQVYLMSGENGVISGGYLESEDFDASATDVTFGRYQKSTGTYNFVAMSSATPGGENTYPVVGPIVINEIMYSPPQGSDAEYVELYNTSSSPVILQSYDSQLYTNVGWVFDEGISYSFPLGTVIPGYGYAILARNPSFFTATYGSLPSGVGLFGPYDGKLDGAGEKVQLSIPVGIDRDSLQMDRVTYDDEAPWPTSPDGSGHSLSRIDPDAYGNDPNNWVGQSPSPGVAN